MKLEYFTGKNFGDALNPFIFQHFLPNFFDDNPEETFFGIGSILGFGLAKDVKKKIIFSSGYAYGEIPEIDSTYDFVCVRGPLTANALNLPSDAAVADGAILLQFMDIPKPVKKYKFSFMPHWGSEQKYSKWPEVCAAAGIHYISPMQDKDFVLQEILKSEVVIAEAMHAAIVADTLGVPWIPVKAYPTINEFKWNDWAASLNLTFEFSKLSSLYENNEFMFEKLNERTQGIIPKAVIKGSLNVLQKTYFDPKTKQVVKQMERVKLQPQHISNRDLLKDKGNELLKRLELVKKKYS
ncbi:polysaccharide pyruvyl transferase family protein [Owenweeksia hongkongensis]|uniref:polysaccharide pyruvyl transferase family protein n=1 Tax=Owenweeksia hongkongensis TaxID=253245 RepID=UPI003A94E2E2